MRGPEPNYSSFKGIYLLNRTKTEPMVLYRHRPTCWAANCGEQANQPSLCKERCHDALHQKRSPRLGLGDIEGAMDYSCDALHTGKSVDEEGLRRCAGVIAALSYQMDIDPQSFVEAFLADALNIYDVVLWAENAGHQLLTQRKDADGATRVLIKPNGSH